MVCGVSSGAWCVKRCVVHKVLLTLCSRRFEPLFFTKQINTGSLLFHQPTSSLRNGQLHRQGRGFLPCLYVSFSSSGPETGGRETNYLFISSTDVRLLATLPTSSVSQRLAGLRPRVRWWLASSDHDVRIVLLAGFDRELSPAVTLGGRRRTREGGTRRVFEPCW